MFRRSRTIVFFLTIGLVSQGDASELSRRTREKRETRAIFAMLLAKIRPGDGWAFDDPCVISERWPNYVERDGNVRQVDALLTPREAMDPKGAHPEKFCDVEARDTAMREKAKALQGDEHASVGTADIKLSYPIFNRRLTRARVQREGGNQKWYKNGKGDFVASGGVIYLMKRRGVWRSNYETDWIAN